MRTIIAYLYRKLADYLDGNSESRLNDAIERELAEYGAPEGSDRNM